MSGAVKLVQKAEKPVVQIEYCRGCHNHATSTRHRQRHYKETFEAIKKTLEASGVEVRQAPSHRLGAFEVHSGDWLVYSKLRNGVMPDATAVVGRLLGTPNPEQKLPLQFTPTSVTWTVRTVAKPLITHNASRRSNHSCVNLSTPHIKRTSQSSKPLMMPNNKGFFSSRKINAAKYTEEFRPELLATIRRTRPTSLFRRIHTEPQPEESITASKLRDSPYKGPGISKAQMSSSMLHLLDNAPDLSSFVDAHRMRTSQI